MGALLVLLALPKLTQLRAFARAFRAYDPVASALPLYGFVYPFLELGLGVARWRARSPSALRRVYVATIAMMGVGFAGVLRALWAAGRARVPPPECGCLGTVLRMPLSHVTLVETAAMLGMAAHMLAQQQSHRVRFSPKLTSHNAPPAWGGRVANRRSGT